MSQDPSEDSDMVSIWDIVSSQPFVAFGVSAICALAWKCL